MGQYLPCFKAYDVRGKVPSELNPDIAYAIGRAYADQVKPSKVCIGYDIRLSGPDLYRALAKGLNDAGVDVMHLGMIGTEMVYFATAAYGLDGGIMITASHNPPEYNGLKMVRAESRPISGDTGLLAIEKLAFDYLSEMPAPTGSGSIEDKDCYADFVAHLLRIVSPSDIKPLRVLADPGNGAAGLALTPLLPHLPLEVTLVRPEPDGNFPNGVPNPILEESRAMTVAAMQRESYAFGVAWDGDYDRCFFFDEHGEFIEGYYIVGLLAQAILKKDPNHTIIYDPRLMWNTLDIVRQLGGRAVVCKSGHAFIKEKMRAEDATYGGEMSAHHYFKDHWYCDSGMIPFLLVARLVSQTGRNLGDLGGEMIANYPCSGEVNSEVPDVKTVLARVESHYSDGIIDRIDGLSVEYPNWRFNLRGSNTEPVIRLNVETRGDKALMESKTAELLGLIRA
ncbi:MAG: phosphomannomutase CpsG [Fimbriimonadaceae bacterium]|nr:phosphomannomutase CpsG [Fimbriimonadaceae bacterium]